jgi:hypothetical protein
MEYNEERARERRRERERNKPSAHQIRERFRDDRALRECVLKRERERERERERDEKR